MTAKVSLTSFASRHCLNEVLFWPLPGIGMDLHASQPELTGSAEGSVLEKYSKKIIAEDGHSFRNYSRM